jgi:hypothetical protein
MTALYSAHPREGGDPVLWVIGDAERKRSVVLKRPGHAGQNWVPAFAGMSGFMMS